jgi:hypothetical protein
MIMYMYDKPCDGTQAWFQLQRVQVNTVLASYVPSEHSMFSSSSYVPFELSLMSSSSVVLESHVKHFSCKIIQAVLTRSLSID